MSDAKEIYEWTSHHHDEKCPRHPKYPADKFEALQRGILKLGKSAPIPDGAPLPDCIGSETCCPADIVINASTRPIIIGADGVEEVAQDPPRVDVGDRRQGAYYTKQIGLPVMLGLMRVRDVPLARLMELEKIRQVRTGERPPDWVIEARRRAERGEDPPAFSDKKTAMSELERAVRGLDD